MAISVLSETTNLEYTKRNSHSVLRLLLEKGSDHTGTVDPYGTLIHLIAEFADLEALQLLQQGDLVLRDTNTKNSNGQTPYQVALYRQDVGEQWMLGFGH